MEAVIAERFAVRTEYFLGVKDNKVFESANAADAALYIILGKRRASA
jgi:FKBP-type peptidyl-prolyl cis-trans isomerase 2